MGKTPEILIPALRQYRHNYGSEQYIAGFDYDDTVKIVRDLEQQLSTLREAARKLAESVREEGGSLAVVGAKEFRALSSELYDQTEQDNE